MKCLYELYKKNFLMMMRIVMNERERERERDEERG